MSDLFEVNPVGIASMVIGGFVVLISLFSLFVREKVCMSEVVIGTLFGTLMGPLCAGIFDPRSWTMDSNPVTFEVMRIVLVLDLFAAGVDLPEKYMYTDIRGFMALVIPTMTIGWFIVAALLKTLFGSFGYVTCLVLAACLTPTDPIISAAIIGGKFATNNVPEKIRHILLAESAANDGLASLFLSLSLTLGSGPSNDLRDWILTGVLYQVIFGTFVGAVIGWLISQVLRFSVAKGLVDQDGHVAQFISVPLLVMGVVYTIGADDLLAVFAAGCAISWSGEFKKHIRGQSFAAVIGYILNCGCFFYIGAWLPWNDFSSPAIGVSPWRLVVFSVSVLVLRRFPAILVLHKYVPQIKGWKQALLCGHFGPMGVSAIFVSCMAVHRLPDPQTPPTSQQDVLAMALPPVVGFSVLASILVHGLSIPLFLAGRQILCRARSLDAHSEGLITRDSFQQSRISTAVNPLQDMNDPYFIPKRHDTTRLGGRYEPDPMSICDFVSDVQLI